MSLRGEGKLTVDSKGGVVLTGDHSLGGTKVVGIPVRDIDNDTLVHSTANVVGVVEKRADRTIYQNYNTGCCHAQPVGGTVFRTAMTIIDASKPLVDVPLQVVAICNAIQKLYHGQEFSILLKGEWTENGYLVGSDYRIPSQRVTGASVDFQDDAEMARYRADGFNVIVHSHPFSSSSFSHSDRTTISENFECSLLYSLGNITTGTIMVKIDATKKLIVDITPRVEEIEVILPGDIKSRIIDSRSRWYYNDGYKRGGGRTEIVVRTKGKGGAHCSTRSQSSLETDETDDVDPLMTPDRYSERFFRGKTKKNSQEIIDEISKDDVFIKKARDAFKQSSAEEAAALRKYLTVGS